MDELENILCARKSRAYLASLGITTDDAWTLVKLLDDDNTGTIDLQEFITGCMGLRGNAKAVHLATLAYDQRIASSVWDEFIDRVDKQLSMIAKNTDPFSE